jgi:hypothetical protein
MDVFGMVAALDISDYQVASHMIGGFDISIHRTGYRLPGPVLAQQ